MQRHRAGRTHSLVINAGSSSLKFCVFACTDQADGSWQAAARGVISGIGTSPAFSARDADGNGLSGPPLRMVRDARDALDYLAVWLQAHFGGTRLAGVGHRVVHGGLRYSRPTLVTRDVLADLRALERLAPLHQPYNLQAIEAVSVRFPDVPQVACFDTGFHRGQPAVARLVPLPPEVCNGVERYGFHGLSYEYVAGRSPAVAPELAGGRVIVAHLGNGASLCALRDGSSVDSTLGFTALDGLCMGTRPGSLDPGIVLYLFQTLQLSAGEVESILYHKSGLLGISGISSDMRELLDSDAPRARLAVDYFVYRATREVAALSGVLGGLDGLVFTAGIGENSPEIRRRVCEGSAWLGIELDRAANVAGEPRISRGASKVSVWVIPTNEELTIARHLQHVLGLGRSPSGGEYA